MKSNLKYNVAAAAVGISAILAQNAQADFGVNLSTRESNLAGAAITTRLYNAPGVPAEGQSPSPQTLWLVFDINENGTVFAPGALTGVVMDNTPTMAELIGLMLDPGDIVVDTGTPVTGYPSRFQGLYPTGINYATDGQASQNIINIDPTAQNGGTGTSQRSGTVKPSYTILFGERILDTGALLDGGTFGYAQNDVFAQIPAASGNAELRITSDIFANSYSFTPIPEPATAAYVGLGLAGLALLRRRMARA